MIILMKVLFNRNKKIFILLLKNKPIIMKKNTFSGSKLIIGSILILIIFSVTNNCSKSSSGTPGANAVVIQGMAFNPLTITVSAGTSITWTNKDAVAHTVTSNTGIFDSGSISTNGTFSYTFNTAGTFPYHCTVHPYMTATVIVQ
jgi:plastocyanin